MNGLPKEETEVFHFRDPGIQNCRNDFHLGSQMGVADLNYTSHLLNQEKCTLVYTGDGGASEEISHEAVNIAAVWNLPVIIVVENNQWDFPRHLGNNLDANHCR